MSLFNLLSASSDSVTHPGWVKTYSSLGTNIPGEGLRFVKPYGACQTLEGHIAVVGIIVDQDANAYPKIDAVWLDKDTGEIVDHLTFDISSYDLIEFIPCETIDARGLVRPGNAVSGFGQNHISSVTVSIPVIRTNGGLYRECIDTIKLSRTGVYDIKTSFLVSDDELANIISISTINTCTSDGILGGSSNGYPLLIQIAPDGTAIGKVFYEHGLNEITHIADTNNGAYGYYHGVFFANGQITEYQFKYSNIDLSFFAGVNSLGATTFSTIGDGSSGPPTQYTMPRVVSSGRTASGALWTCGTCDLYGVECNFSGLNADVYVGWGNMYNNGVVTDASNSKLLMATSFTSSNGTQLVLEYGLESSAFTTTHAASTYYADSVQPMVGLSGFVDNARGMMIPYSDLTTLKKRLVLMYGSGVRNEGYGFKVAGTGNIFETNTLGQWPLEFNATEYSVNRGAPSAYFTTTYASGIISSQTFTTYSNLYTSGYGITSSIEIT